MNNVKKRKLFEDIIGKSKQGIKIILFIDWRTPL